MTNTTSLCQDIITKDFDPWFSDDADEQAYARSVCQRCPVWATCTVFGIVNDFEFGIFGGLDPEQRKPLRDRLVSDLPADDVAALVDKYFVEDIMPPEYATPSVEAKYLRRQARAQFCLERLNDTHPDEIPRFQRYLDCVTAVVDSPTSTGEDLGKKVGLSTATFNQYLRECFEHFQLDLSVL